MSSLRTRRKVLLAKLESTYGTDPVPTGAANAILVSSFEVTPLAASYISRDLIRPFFGASEQYPDAAHVMMKFETEIVGSGTVATAPAWGALLQGCAMAETITALTDVQYKPITDNLKSLTLYANIDGVLHKMRGARGEVEIRFSSKQLPKMAWEFTGLFTPVIDAAGPTVDFTAWKKPLPVNTVNTTGLTLMGASGLVMESLTLKMGNKITHQSLVGGEEVLITDRKPEGSLRIQATNIATHDWFADALAANSGVVQLDHGLTAGTKVRLRLPNASITNPTYSDQDGVQMMNLTLTANPGASGNDEVAIICT